MFFPLKQCSHGKEYKNKISATEDMLQKHLDMASYRLSYLVHILNHLHKLVPLELLGFNYTTF